MPLFPGRPVFPDTGAVAQDDELLPYILRPPRGASVIAEHDQAAEIISAHGISEVPQDRGLALVTRREDCPLPGGYTIPEPYIVAADGIHLMKDDGTGHARVTWAWLFPVRVYVDPCGDQLVELAWRDGPRWVSRSSGARSPRAAGTRHRGR